MAKNNQDNQIQSITLCKMYFSKKVYAVYNGVWGKAPEAGEFSRIFVLKVTLESVRLLLTGGAGCTSLLVAVPIILLGATCSPAPPVRDCGPRAQK